MTTLFKKKQEFEKRTEGKVAVLSNGKQLFVLKDYSKTAQICAVNNITINKWVSPLKIKAMHEKGQLHYINGVGDRKLLNGDNTLKRGKKIGNFEIW